MLRSLWSALLQDYALLSTQHPAVLAAYASELLPPLATTSAAAATARVGGDGQLLALAAVGTTLEPLSGVGAASTAAVAAGGSASVASTALAAAVCGTYRAACPQVLEALVSEGIPAIEVLEQVGFGSPVGEGGGA